MHAVGCVPGPLTEAGVAFDAKNGVAYICGAQAPASACVCGPWDAACPLPVPGRLLRSVAHPHSHPGCAAAPPLAGGYSTAGFMHVAEANAILQSVYSAELWQFSCANHWWRRLTRADAQPAMVEPAAGTCAAVLDGKVGGRGAGPGRCGLHARGMHGGPPGYPCAWPAPLPAQQGPTRLHPTPHVPLQLYVAGGYMCSGPEPWPIRTVTSIECAAATAAAAVGCCLLAGTHDGLAGPPAAWPVTCHHLLPPTHFPTARECARTAVCPRRARPAAACSSARGAGRRGGHPSTFAARRAARRPGPPTRLCAAPKACCPDRPGGRACASCCLRPASVLPCPASVWSRACPAGAAV